jgi:hypothetical protein
VLPGLDREWRWQLRLCETHAVQAQEWMADMRLHFAPETEGSADTGRVPVAFDAFAESFTYQFGAATAAG